MPTPKRGYYAADGKRVPSVTTIMGKFKESGGIVHWAWECGLEGIDYQAEKKAAGTVGTAAHAMIEMAISGKFVKCPLEDDDTSSREMIEATWNAFRQFEEWQDKVNLGVIAQEIQLVSEKHRFGGTPDAVGYIGKKERHLSLLDWKTGNAIYSDHICQVAAYVLLWNENNPDNPITGGCHIIRISKDHGVFTYKYVSDLALEVPTAQFLALRESYERDKILQKMVK